MAVLNKIMRLGSMYLAIFACCLFKLPGVYTFRFANPAFYGNSYDYDLVPEKLNPKDETEQTTIISDSAINVQTEEFSNADLLKRSKVNFDLPLFSKIDEQPESDEITTKKLLKTPAIGEDDPIKNFFAFDSPKTTDIDSLDSTDDFSMQVTKIYLKAITTLIQHIMDIIFFVNDTTKPPKLTTGAPTNIDGALSSSPSRKLRKRDLSNAQKESSKSEISTSSINTNAVPEKSNLASEKTPSFTELQSIATGKSLEINHSGEHDGSTKTESRSNLKQTTSESHQKISAFSNSPEPKSEPTNKENVNLPLLSSQKDDSGINSQHVSEKTSTLKNNEKVAAVVTDKNDLKKTMFDEKGHLKHEDGEDVSIESLINDQNSLMDDSMTEQDIYEPNESSLEKISVHKFSKKSVEDESTTKESSSFAGTFFVITGTVLFVIVLAAAGTAAAYQLRKRTLGQIQTSSSQRAAMA